jgi:hypothetical protein
MFIVQHIMVIFHVNGTVGVRYTCRWGDARAKGPRRAKRAEPIWAAHVGGGEGFDTI